MNRYAKFQTEDEEEDHAEQEEEDESFVLGDHKKRRKGDRTEEAQALRLRGGCGDGTDEDFTESEFPWVPEAQQLTTPFNASSQLPSSSSSVASSSSSTPSAPPPPSLYSLIL